MYNAQNTYELFDLVDNELAKYTAFKSISDEHRYLLKVCAIHWNITKNLINTYLSELSSMYYPGDELHILARKLRILHIYQER